MLLKDKQVAVIGAGPVGLTMARLLQQEGTDVTVYERDRDAQARIWGGTLDLHRHSGQVAMNEAGLLDAYYKVSFPMGVTFADEQANVLLTKHPTPENRYDNPEINRNDLRKILLDSLAAGTVVWDHRFTGLEAQRGKWLLHFEGRPDATADLVIGASGGMSAVRRYVTDAEAEETGTFIIQGDVARPERACPEFYRLCDGNRLMAAFGGNLLVANPRNRDALTYGVIFRKPEMGACIPDFRQADRARTFLVNRFSRWDKRYNELFRATSSFWGLPTRMLPLGKPWKKVRPLPVTLIGDAAHLMPPFAGQGVNTGLTDAMVLSAALTGGTYETIAAAIEGYERQMLVYAQAAQLESVRNEAEMFRPGFSFRQFHP